MQTDSDKMFILRLNDAEQALEFEAAARVNGLTRSAMVRQFAQRLIREAKREFPDEFPLALAAVRQEREDKKQERKTKRKPSLKHSEDLDVLNYVRTHTESESAPSAQEETPLIQPVP